jgi:F-type H+-transporting ATPase subunit delta
MKSSKSAIRYAQALLDLSVEKNCLDAVAKDMKYFSTVCAENRDFELMLTSPIVKADKKIEIIKAVFDQFNVLTISFVELIAKNRREGILPQIANEFDSLLKAFKGIVPITITSAKKLDEKTMATIVAKVQSSVKGTLEVTEMLDENLIGGFIVRMGDTQIDASVASQLTNLKQRLTR